MRIKKLSAVLKRGSSIFIYSSLNSYGETSRQWAAGLNSIYPLNKLPIMSTQEFCSVLDLTAKELEKTVIQEDFLPSEIYNFDDTDPNEIPLRMLPLSIDFNNSIYFPLHSEQSKEVFFIDTAYVQPIEDIGGEALFFRRKQNGQSYIAIKSGMLLEAIILPANLSCSVVFCDAIKLISQSLKDHESDIYTDNQDDERTQETNHIDWPQGAKS